MCMSVCVCVHQVCVFMFLKARKYPLCIESDLDKARLFKMYISMIQSCGLKNASNLTAKNDLCA